MRCPHCQVSLKTETLDGKPASPDLGPFRSNPRMLENLQQLHGALWVERCGRCHGIFFDAGELSEALRSMKLLDVPPPPQAFSFGATNARDCPKCQRRMVSYQSPAFSIIYERCPTCSGLWLDIGEVLHMANPLVALSGFLHNEFD